MNCNGVIGKDCGCCNELCIFKFSDEEWEAYSHYACRIISALKEKEFIQESIDEYWNLKRELNKKGLLVEDVVNIDINSLRRQKKEVDLRIKQLRRNEYEYAKRLSELL